MPDEPDPPRSRRITTPLALPSGRAVVGGLLVAVSVLGLFAAHRSVTHPDRVAWLVVRRPIAAGTTLAADDLVLAPMDLGTEVGRRAIHDPAQAIGRVALVTLSSGDLVLRSNLVEAADAGGPGRRVGIAVDPANALAGELSPGDRVDVVAVADESAALTPDAVPTAVIVRAALVSTIDRGGAGGVGSSDRLRIVLDVPGEDAATAIIEADAHDRIRLIAGSTVHLDEPGS